MSEATLIGFGSLLIALVVCVYNLVRGNRQDSTQQAKDASETTRLLTEIKTSQDFTANDMKDVKADLRSFQRDLQEVRATASLAKASADKANQRIDDMERGSHD